MIRLGDTVRLPDGTITTVRTVKWELKNPSNVWFEVDGSKDKFVAGDLVKVDKEAIT